MSRFRKQKTIVLMLDAANYAKSKGFNDTADCPIATAFKTMFPSCKKVSVSDGLTVYGKGYDSAHYTHYDIVGDVYKPGYVERTEEEGQTLPIILKRVAKRTCRR